MDSAPDAAARLLGVTVADFPAPDDAMGLMGFMDVIQDASLSLAISEAWLMLAGLSSLAVVLVWAMGPIRMTPGVPANNPAAKL